MIHIKRIDEMFFDNETFSELDERQMIDTPKDGKMFLQVTVGFGYNDQYDFFVWADDYENALCKVMVFFERENGKIIRRLSDIARDAVKELNDIDENKEGRTFETEADFDEYYTIATGNKQDYYLLSEFTTIKEANDDYKQYVLDGGRDGNENNIKL